MKKLPLWAVVSIVIPFFSHAKPADLNHSLTPKLVNYGELISQYTFDTSFEIKPRYESLLARQGTNWEVKNGRLVGKESSKAYKEKKIQSGKKGHTGNIPRLQLDNKHKNIIFSYKFKLSAGSGSKLIPMVESGHHIRRVYFGENNIKLLVDREKTTIDEQQFTFKDNQWYEVMLELNDDEFVFQVENGPTLYGKHDSVNIEHKDYNLQITGKVEGVIEVDNLFLWHAGEKKVN
ncbi:hypothetical protein [Thalassotalea crassostreae]|uniref:hypothetical protein n=1 Tax=Thalassotalea crassostreae TaxID=1763536 RepID=UPI000837C809|nr:hypothetical protein [Thalassotalea crassostreae]